MIGRKIPLYMKEAEQQGLRTASQFNAQLMDFIRPHVVVGVSTAKLDTLIHDFTRDHGHIPACLGYKGYPKSSCISINEVVCHGIPSPSLILRDGDIANVDITTIVDGWYGDQSETFLIGNVSEDARKLTQVTFDSLWAGINALHPGCTVNDIGQAIVDYVRPKKYGVVQEYQGHGIGREFHQSPGIPHYPCLETRKVKIAPGTCFTIEPMLNLGKPNTIKDRTDGWTVRTLDNSLSAQFEHTILMTETGPEPLTLTKDGPQEGHVF